MTLSKNQLRWADTLINDEEIKKQIIEGKDPLQIIEEEGEEIIELCNSKSNLLQIGWCFEEIKKHSLVILDIKNYLKETTVPI